MTAGPRRRARAPMGTTPQSPTVRQHVHGVLRRARRRRARRSSATARAGDSVCDRELRLRTSTGTETRARPARQTLSAPAGPRRRARAPRTTGPRSQAAPGRASYAPAENQGCDLDGSRPARARMRTPSVLTRLRATTNHYLSGGECVACPDDSTSTEAASTACRCPDNEYAEWSNGGGGSWSCESCPDGTVKSGGSVIPQASEASDSCNADCASRTSTALTARASPARTTRTVPAGPRRRARAPRTTGPRSPAAPGRASYAPAVEPRTATSTVPGSGSSEDDDDVCVDATSCDANHYLSGGECVSCPTFDDKESTSASASSTTCTCPAGYYADKTTSCKACPVGSSRTGSTIFGDSEKEDDSVCVANCASGKYWDGDSCEACPANSVGAGGAATTCTCAANYWAKKSGSTWTCELCSGQRTKDATSTVPGSGKSEDDDAVCVDATSCTANHYLSGGECVACADGSTSTDATSTTCECGAAQYFADGSCNACPSTSTCASPPCSAVTECECPADHYVEWKSNNWVCTECKSGQTKTATAIPADKSSEETASACSAATTCATTTITWPRMMIRA